MNPLSIFNAAARGTGMKDPDGYAARDDAGQDDPAQSSSFANLLNTGPRQDPQAQAAASRRETRRDDNADARRDEAAEKDPANRAEASRDKRTARTGQGDKRQGEDADSTAEAKGPDDTARTVGEHAEDTAEASNDDAGAWPPPGLGGFGLMLMQPTDAAPVANATALVANTAAGLMAGQATTDAASAPAAAAAPGAIALPGLAATPVTAQPAAAPGQDAAALAALANAAVAPQAANADAGGDDAAAPAIDGPAFVLPNLPHATGAGRANEASPVFSASPTPTPNLHGDDFDEAVGTRLTWLAEQKIGHAHIKITPNDLGPVEVHLQMDGDKVHASFSAAHVETRQALEQSLPRLRDMLGEHGFQLAHADVGAQQQQGQRGDAGAATAGLEGRADTDEAASVVIPAAVLKARGLLDAYA